MDEFSSNVDGDTSMNQHSKGSPVRVPRHHPLLPPAFFSHARAEGTRVSSLVQLYHAMRITTNCFHETFVQTILTTIVAENNVSKQ